MKKKRLILLIVSAVIVVAVSGGLIALAGNEGTATDPLITKGYLEQVFTPQVEGLINDAVAAASKAESDKLDGILADYKKQISDLVNQFNANTGSELENEAYVALLEKAVSERLAQVEVKVPSEAAVYRTVTLTAGQTLYCNEGAEFFLREGSGSSVAGLLDVPAGTVRANGEALAANTLYIAPASGSGIKAGSNATVFIRGGYSVN
ncbi:MAG: hypothetical protein IKM29_00090 [Clostridia bacterium]|nr:hypothetical protein [Clostridia bacterium]